MKFKKYDTFEELRDYGDICIFTDGATFNNGKKDPDLPSLGGWGFVIADCYTGETLAEGKGGPGGEETTISRMELEGAIQGITRAIKMFTKRSNFDDPVRISVVSDSQYVVQGITDWIQGWISRGWKNNKNEPTPNRDQWELLACLSGVLEKTTLDITWVKVKGHSNVPLNEIADQLAGSALLDEKALRGL